MRPFVLKGHERPLTKVQYNRDGDLLFTAALDKKPCLWYTHNGERVGTYNGHNGAVFALDVNFDCRYLLTGSADCTAKLWDTERGVALHTWEHKSPVRAVHFAHGDQMFLTVQDDSYKQIPTIFVYTLNTESKDQDSDPVRKLTDPAGMGKVTSALWGPTNNEIITGSNDGFLRVWSVDDGKLIFKQNIHKKEINDIQFSQDYTMFITASSDHTAKLFDTETCTLKKTYVSDRPLNSAAICPKAPYIIIGGGQQARDVTQTDAKMGHFETDFYHMIFENKVSSVKGHFGPVNTLAFSPDGKGFTSGSEDGFVRLHHFEPDVYNVEEDS